MNLPCPICSMCWIGKLPDMARNKPPRKPYTPRPIVKPLNLRDQTKVELDAQMALEMVKLGLATEDHLSMICSHADIVRRIVKSGPAWVQANTILRIAGEIMDRPEFRILSGQAVAIEAALSVTLPVVQTCGNLSIDRASRAALRDFDRFGGLRVTL